MGQNSIKNSLSGKKILGIIFIVYLGITLMGALSHQPWRDEAQSWLIARDLNPIEIIKQMPYEGIPPLWYFILYPFATNGFPYSTEFIIHYLIAAAAIFLLLFFSPLPKSVKILLPFSYYFLFEYSVIARNYGLIILLLFLIAALYPGRLKRPLIYAAAIAIFTWSGIQALGVAAILTLYFIIETLQEKLKNKRYLLAIIIMVIAQVSVVLMLLPYQNQKFAGLNFNGFYYLAKAAAVALLPFFNSYYMPHIYFWILASSWFILIPSILKSKTARIIFLASSAWLFFIILFKHPGETRHYGLLLIILIFAWWLDFYYHPRTKLPKSLINLAAVSFLLICLAGGAGYSAYYYYANRQTNFSGAKEMANYLKDNNLVNEEIVSYPEDSGRSLLPYLPGKQFYQLMGGKKGKDLTWNKKIEGVPLVPYWNRKTEYAPLMPYWLIKEKLWQSYEQIGTKPESLLVLTTWPLEQYSTDFVLITTNQKLSYTDEYFYLYRFPASHFQK